MRRFIGLIGRFGRDERGVFAVMFGLMAIVLIALGGATVDYVSLEQTRNRGQIALDAAALALQPKIYDTSEADLGKLAEALMVDRIGQSAVKATVIKTVADEDVGSLYFEAMLTTPTTFVSLVGVNSLSARIISEATQGSSLEVAVALDLSNSMNNSIPNGKGGNTTKIAALRDAINELIDLLVLDDQTPTYSKMALVPYSQAVNAGTYANAVRGAITQPTPITNIAWSVGTAKAITGATKASPVVITSNGHGFTNGDYVYISGAGGMNQINNNIFMVAGSSTNTFQLQGINGSGYNAYTSGGTATECLVSTCELVVSSNGHGLSQDAKAYITGVVASGTTTENYSATLPNGTPEYRSSDNIISWPGGSDHVNYNWINNNPSDVEYKFLTWDVGPVTANTFVLHGTPRTNGKNYGTYTSGGTVSCVVEGCTYRLFTNPYSGGSNGANTSQRRHMISTCVTERDVNTFTDASYLTTLLGRNYPSSNNTCISDVILPLTSTRGAANSTNKSDLHGLANTLTASGSTGGQIGVAWAWYLVSARFNGPWPVASRPAADDTTPPVAKAVVLMTDGEYNSIYKQGIIAQNSTTGSGDTNSMIGQNANNNSSYIQAQTLCQSMKDAGITVFTVGLAIDDKPIAKEMMLNCASDPSKAYVAGTGQALSDVFADIAANLSTLRITH